MAEKNFLKKFKEEAKNLEKSRQEQTKQKYSQFKNEEKKQNKGREE